MLTDQRTKLFPESYSSAATCLYDINIGHNTARCNVKQNAFQKLRNQKQYESCTNLFLIFVLEIRELSK